MASNSVSSKSNFYRKATTQNVRQDIFGKVNRSAFIWDSPEMSIRTPSVDGLYQQFFNDHAQEHPNFPVERNFEQSKNGITLIV